MVYLLLFTVNFCHYHSAHTNHHIPTSAGDSISPMAYISSAARMLVRWAVLRALCWLTFFQRLPCLCACCYATAALVCAVALGVPDNNASCSSLAVLGGQINVSALPGHAFFVVKTCHFTCACVCFCNFIFGFSGFRVFGFSVFCFFFFWFRFCISSDFSIVHISGGHSTCGRLWL